jgi:hypothetical protein
MLRGARDGLLHSSRHRHPGRGLRQPRLARRAGLRPIGFGAPLSENRGVPGSSPGLAIREPPWDRCFLVSGAARLRPRMGHGSGHATTRVLEFEHRSPFVAGIRGERPHDSRHEAAVRLETARGQTIAKCRAHAPTSRHRACERHADGRRVLLVLVRRGRDFGSSGDFSTTSPAMARAAAASALASRRREKQVSRMNGVDRGTQR